MKTPIPDARLKRAAQENYEKISGSQTFCVLFNEKMVDAVIPLLQMGLAVYLDKPIVILAPIGASIPANLRAMAVGVEEFDPTDLESLHAATQRLHQEGHL